VPLPPVPLPPVPLPPVPLSPPQPVASASPPDRSTADIDS
jgi:hypothetical protein